MNGARPVAAMFGGSPGKRAAGPRRDSVADAVLARAEAAVDALSAEYPGHAMRDIASLIALTERAADDSLPATERFAEISRIAHDMRGQGTVFGFPMMTRCAGSLCRATRRMGPGDAAVRRVVRTHIAALYAILRRGARRDDPVAASIAGGLEMLVAACLRDDPGQ